MWFVLILMAGIWSAVGRLVERWPETLAGYSTLSSERRRYVDIRALGRFAARLLYACAGITLAGLPALLIFEDKAVAAVCLLIPLPLLLVGAVWGSWRYDRKFMRRFKRKNNG